jgi:two-component system, chemotaxis family, sensor kinase CheA
VSSPDPELTKLLAQELERHLRALEGEAQKADGADLEAVRRSVHALKGSAGLAGEPELAASMLRLERRLRTGEREALAEAVGTIREAVARLGAGLTAVAGAWPVPPADLGPHPIDPLVRAQYVAEVTDRLAQIDAALGSSGEPVDAAEEVYRHVHTMKGAASAAGDEPMAWFCHGLEERIRGGTSSREAATAALGDVAKHRAILGMLLDDSEAALATLRGLPLRRSMRPSQRPAGWPDDEGAGDATIRVSAQAVDRLLDHVASVTVARERVAARVVRATAQAHALRKVRAELAEALRLIGPPRPWGAPAAALRRIERAAQTAVELGDELDRAADGLLATDQALKDNTGAAKKLLSEMRQTPVRGLFARLSVAALAEARRTGRLVAIRSIGADETIDRRLAEQLAEPCLQLTRNAIAHGIETPEVRESLGKPREATVTLAARKLGARLVVTIGDDGAGVDVAAVRTRAVDAGVVAEVLAEAADDQTLLELLFLPGFSTRGQSPDLLAGRGIGLDITLASVQKLGGGIRLSSHHGRGFEARIDVPIESGLARVLWVRAGGIEHAMPAQNAKRVRLPEGMEADRVPHLATCLDPITMARTSFVVELDVGLEAPDVISLGVDAAFGTEEVLVRELSPLLRGVGPYAGAVVRGDGSLRLALDVQALAPRVRALGRVPEGRVSEIPSRPPPSRPPPLPR